MNITLDVYCRFLTTNENVARFCKRIFSLPEPDNDRKSCKIHEKFFQEKNFLQVYFNTTIIERAFPGTSFFKKTSGNLYINHEIKYFSTLLENPINCTHFQLTRRLQAPDMLLKFPFTLFCWNKFFGRRRSDSPDSKVWNDFSILQRKSTEMLDIFRIKIAIISNNWASFLLFGIRFCCLSWFLRIHLYKNNLKVFWWIIFGGSFLVDLWSPCYINYKKCNYFWISLICKFIFPQITGFENVVKVSTERKPLEKK